MKNGKNIASKEIVEYDELQRYDILDWLGVIECVRRCGFLLLLWQKEEFSRYLVGVTEGATDGESVGFPVV
jgi:hypothetical protein